jgi:hypothetical protein
MYKHTSAFGSAREGRGRQCCARMVGSCTSIGRGGGGESTEKLKANSIPQEERGLPIPPSYPIPSAISRAPSSSHPALTPHIMSVWQPGMSWRMCWNGRTAVRDDTQGLRRLTSVATGYCGVLLHVTTPA